MKQKISLIHRRATGIPEGKFDQKVTLKNQPLDTK